MIRVFIDIPLPGNDPAGKVPFVVASAHGDFLPPDTTAEVRVNESGIVTEHAALANYTGYLWLISQDVQYGITFKEGTVVTVLLVSGGYAVRQEFLFVVKGRCRITDFTLKHTASKRAVRSKKPLSRYQRIKRLKRILGTLTLARAMDNILGWDYVTPNAIPISHFQTGVPTHASK